MRKQIIQTIRRLMNSLKAQWASLRPLITKTLSTQSTGEPSALTIKRGVIYKGLLALVAVILAVVMLFTMTTAWYKNVVQTSGLLFHVDQWGLDSSVNVQDELIGAVPGDNGVINLSVDNTSTGVISVTFGVSKGDLYNELADMRKRLFFYIDDMAYRGGEHTSRVYLNSVETYSYTVLPQHDLVLGTNGNAAPLCWEWVFDVLGYYFYGSVIAEGTASVSEYLRPIDYTLDNATFRNGVLTTVDGTTTTAEFLQELSEYDGYEGTVGEAVIASDGRVYYPVSVDDEGTGVWIYLCNWGEIEYETTEDTRLGSAENDTDRQFETYLHVTAQQKQLSVIDVATEAQLTDALNSNAYDLVQLTGNVALTQRLRLKVVGEKILDLNGYTLSSDQSYMLSAYQDVSLTIMNGTIKGGGTATSYAVTATSSDVALSNVTITDCRYGVCANDSSSPQADSYVTMTGCTIRSSVGCVYVLGNGTSTKADTCVVIEDCELESTGYYAVLGNGSTEGTDIRILNSKLRGVDSGIYHPQANSTLLLQGSTVEAVTPVVVKGGSVEIIDSTITALTGEEYDKMIEPPMLANSGFACTGAGVYVETNYNKPCVVKISGNTSVTSTHCDAITKMEVDNPQFVIVVTGGKYSHDVSAFVDANYICKKEKDHWVVSER